MRKIALLATALFVTSLASAHVVWIEPAKGEHQYVVKFGHEETETYPETKLKAVKLLDQKGNLNPAKIEFKAGEGYFNSGEANLVFIRFDNGVWSKLPSGKYVEKTKAEEPSAEFSINPVKLGKAILHWDSQSLKAHDMEYELVPMSQPKAGEPLEILVLHKGQPVSGIKVGLGEDKPFNLSNEKGIAVFVPTKGANKVWAEFEEKVEKNPDYDARSIEYTLTFDVK